MQVARRPFIFCNDFKFEEHPVQLSTLSPSSYSQSDSG